MRIDLDTAGAGLTFPNIELTQYSCFGKCQCTRNDPHNLQFCPRDSQNTFIIYSSIFQNDKSFKKNGIRKFENLEIWTFENLTHLKLWKSEIVNICWTPISMTHIFISITKIFFSHWSWGATLGRPKGRQKRGCWGRAPAYYYLNTRLWARPRR